MELRGIGAVVTGASRGLGAALARELAREGARVVLVARQKGALDDVVREIRNGGGDAHALVDDVGDKRAAHRIAGAAAALVGHVELLVNNASTLGVPSLRPLLDTDCESLEEALRVNVLGPFRLTKLVAGAMAAHGRGVVVDITSDASREAYAAWGAYSISKAALDHLGRIWGAELEGRGVRIVTVNPGEMDTAMHADAMPEADRSTLLAPDTVAKRVVRLVRDARGAPNGSRVEASQWATVTP